MDRVILIRYGEIHLKGKNKKFFEDKLISNIKNKLETFDYKFSYKRSRYVISDYNPNEENAILDKIKTIFGIHSVSVAERVPTDINEIAFSAAAVSGNAGSFRVTVNRADKTFPMSSVEFAAYLGGKILETHPGLTVDLQNREP